MSLAPAKLCLRPLDFGSHYKLAWTKSRKSSCTTPSVGVGVGVGVSKKFNVKVFYVMGKALSGELSCPCDRSCLKGCVSLGSTEINFWVCTN